MQEAGVDSALRGNVGISTKTPYLFIISSTNQLYSGTGTALFEWIKYSRDFFDFSICIDNLVEANYRICREFCRDEGVRFLPSGPAALDGAPDAGVAMAQECVVSGRWPVMEIVSWANAATNLAVVAAPRSSSLLVFTPHTQPLWTLGDAAGYGRVDPVFDRAMAVSDLVCCDSPAELAGLAARSAGCPLLYVPLCIDTARFAPGRHPRLPQILCVADFAEARKRTDLALAAIARRMRRDPGTRAVLAGRSSRDVIPPADLAGRFDQLGYVSAEKLVDLYQTSSLYLLLSDFEAFGIPIAEALGCGTPVVTTATAEVVSLFAGLPGCALVDNTDAAAVDAAIDAAFTQADHARIAAGAHAAFAPDATFRHKRDQILTLLGRTSPPFAERGS
jgi:glycosyltransferase involved in cell wall biosynthesis